MKARGHAVFVIDDEHRKNLEAAMAMIDVARRKRRAKAQARAKATAAKRKADRRADGVGAREPKAGGQYATLAPLAGWKMLVVRMQPAVWYEFGDLAALMPEYSRHSVKAWLFQKLPKMALVERAGNPDFEAPGASETITRSRFLYRVPASAAARAAEWRSALGR